MHRRQVEKELNRMSKAMAAGQGEPKATGTSAGGLRQLLLLEQKACPSCSH